MGDGTMLPVVLRARPVRPVLDVLAGGDLRRDRTLELVLHLRHLARVRIRLTHALGVRSTSQILTKQNLGNRGNP